MVCVCVCVCVRERERERDGWFICLVLLTILSQQSAVSFCSDFSTRESSQSVSKRTGTILKQCHGHCYNPRLKTK